MIWTVMPALLTSVYWCTSRPSGSLPKTVVFIEGWTFLAVWHASVEHKNMDKRQSRHDLNMGMLLVLFLKAQCVISRVKKAISLSLAGWRRNQTGRMTFLVPPAARHQASAVSDQLSFQH